MPDIKNIRLFLRQAEQCVNVIVRSYVSLVWEDESVEVGKWQNIPLQRVAFCKITSTEGDENGHIFSYS
ncbi:MAG: hypothetical protein ABJB86_15410 [Bacteroidota bacterium]